MFIDDVQFFYLFLLLLSKNKISASWQNNEDNLYPSLNLKYKKFISSLSELFTTFDHLTFSVCHAYFFI